MIYHMTYLSNSLKVHGYLSLPSGYELPVSDLHHITSQYYETPDLPITAITCPRIRETKDIRQSRLPALIYCRGGIGKVGKVQTDWIEQYANRGYVVFAPSYRGSEGGEGRDEFGGADNEDVLSAFGFLQNLPFVDPTRISIMGFSRGAINAVQAAVEQTQLHRLIIWGGVSDLAQTYDERIDLRRMLKRVIGGTPTKQPQAYRDRSPLHLASHIQCPVLIIHGTEDLQVDFSHGHNMYNRLKELGSHVEIHCYPDYGHHFPPAIHSLAIKRMFSWVECDLT